MNPRIQVEHTVTEQVTDRDLVIAQLRIASGMTLPGAAADPGRRSRSRGAAMQCRVTTEDPANGFRPDTGTISAYRSPGGPGVRLDGGTMHIGAEVSAHFDSMLVKLTCYGHDFAERRRAGPAARSPSSASAASRRTCRSWPRCSRTRTSRPAGSPRASSTSARSCCSARPSADRGLADPAATSPTTTVNRPNGERPEVVEPVDKLPPPST